MIANRARILAVSILVLTGAWARANCQNDLLPALVPGQKLAVPGLADTRLTYLTAIGDYGYLKGSVLVSVPIDEFAKLGFQQPRAYPDMTSQLPMTCAPSSTNWILENDPAEANKSAAAKAVKAVQNTPFLFLASPLNMFWNVPLYHLAGYDLGMETAKERLKSAGVFERATANPEDVRKHLESGRIAMIDVLGHAYRQEILEWPSNHTRRVDRFYPSRYGQKSEHVMILLESRGGDSYLALDPLSGTADDTLVEDGSLKRAYLLNIKAEDLKRPTLPASAVGP